MSSWAGEHVVKMPRIVARNANISPSKRSFDESTFSTQLVYQQDWDSHYQLASDRDQQVVSYLQPPSSYSASKRRSSSFSRSNIMLAEHNSIMSESFPSFMSVFGSEESEVYRRVDLDDQGKIDQNAFPFMTTQPATNQLSEQHNKPFAHRGSIPSLFSESSDSSPTTTNSTFDSPLISDTSASSSPESATSIAPSTAFRAAVMSSEGKNIMALTTDHSSGTKKEDAPSVQDTTKNVKKLTLDMNLPSIRRPVTAGALESSHPFSAPPSPMREPLKSARKKPTNLTIRTPGYNQQTFPRTIGNVPPTPSSRPGAHLYQPSPGLSSMASPRGPPAGGMFLPLPSLNTTLNQASSFNKRSSLLVNSMLDVREETDSQILKSQETPERGYTDGPVCIYDCGVYLYLEPTAAEACKFDTVINVAKEVRNPLVGQQGEATVMSVWRAESTPYSHEITEPQTAISEYSFKSAWEWPQPVSTVTPVATTPTQSLFAQTSPQPEYVHVKWDHNSEILDDLFPLCKLIDDRVAAGKKVLVHCQLGVSRSASLIIAYGLYKNYQPNFHSMYMAVKDRSKWVGPNMSLIYQLTDFKNKVDRGDEALSQRQPDPAWFVRSPAGPLTPKTTESAPAVSATTSPSAKAFQNFPETNTTLDHRSTPLRLNKALPPVPLFPKEKAAKQPEEEASSAPPPPQKNPATIKRAASRPLPFRERGMDMSIPAHKPRFLPGITLSQSSAVMDLAMKDVPSTPSLFSPRATEFVATPFNIRGAGDLETPGNRQSKEIPSGFSWLPIRKDGHVRTASKDPRSPHQQAEVKGIFRSIDNFL